MSENKKQLNIKDVSAENLTQLLELGYLLKKAIENNDQEQIKLLSVNADLLLDLIGYIMVNAENPNLDQELINVLLKFFGLESRKKRDKEHEEEVEEDRLTKEEKEHRHRIICYEVYKLLNPHQIAGETDLDNFINNIKTRGIKVAMRFEGSEFAKEFTQKDLENLESHKHSFVAALNQRGFKGGGFER